MRGCDNGRASAGCVCTGDSDEARGSGLGVDDREGGVDTLVKDARSRSSRRLEPIDPARLVTCASSRSAELELGSGGDLLRDKGWFEVGAAPVARWRAKERRMLDKAPSAKDDDE